MLLRAGDQPLARRRSGKRRLQVSWVFCASLVRCWARRTDGRSRPRAAPLADSKTCVASPERNDGLGRGVRRSALRLYLRRVMLSGSNPWPVSVLRPQRSAPSRTRQEPSPCITSPKRRINQAGIHMPANELRCRMHPAGIHTPANELRTRMRRAVRRARTAPSHGPRQSR